MEEPQQRAKTAARGYGSRWQKARATYLKHNPLCASCEARGVLVVATVVDHIEPHKGDQAKFWNHDNWQPLCATCHNRKTASEDGAFGNAKGQVKVRADCGLDGLPMDARHHWNR